MYDWLSRWFSSSATTADQSILADANLDSAEPGARTLAASSHASPRSGELGVSWLQRNQVTVDFNQWVFDTASVPTIFVTPAEQRVLDALQAIVDSRQSGANLVRRMPGVIPQLLQSLRTDDFSGADLARKISNDVVLVAEVVRLANSAFYSTVQAITSIEHAVLVLGQNGLRQLISGVAFKPIIGANSGHFTRLIAPRLWLQAEQCALANRLLADDDQVNSFEAFLAGLIQNVGLIAALRVMEQVADPEAKLGSESFCNALIIHARVLSCSIAHEWQFPAAIIEAIEQQGGHNDAANMTPLSRTLAAGDFLSKVQLLDA
ncbi:MAG: HDOD domain-containing protein, partial [Pseudomonadota bacterium]|nr:HDOD domain-containing protein [Pseudomonadota bacterium]